MITKTLKEFASPIITKAMATGARSSTTTTENYGGIGDAMFKQAQLEMNMISLTHQMKSANANMKADNELKVLDTQQWVADRHAQRVEESKDMGDMEKIMGTLQGVATGAATGFAVGNVPGAIIGGVAGGGIAASTYYGNGNATQKREVGGRNQAMMGTVANLAGSLRGMYDSQKGKEAAGAVTKDLAGIAQAVSTMAPGAARDAKIQEYQTKSAAGKAELSKYYGPEQVNNVMEGLSKGAPAIFSNDPDTRDKAQFAMNATSAAANPLMDELSPEGKAFRNSVYSDNNAIMQRRYGSNKNNNQSLDEFYGSSNLGPEVSNYDMGISSIRQAPTTARGGGTAPSANQVTNNTSRAPSNGRTVIQPPQVIQPVSSNVDNSQSYMLNHPGVGGGVTMDDGMGFLRDPIGSISKMNEQGAAAAEVFKPKEESFGDRRSREARNSMAQRFGDEIDEGPQTATPDAPTRKKSTPDVEAWRRGEETSNTRSIQATKKIDEYSAQIDDNLSKAGEDNFMATDGLAKGEYLQNAKTGLDGIKEILPRLPQDSAIDAMAAKVYLHGLKTGKMGSALGTSIGLKGGIAGVIAGQVIGDTMDTVFSQGDILRGSATTVGAVLTEDQRDALDQYYSAVLDTIPAYVKSGDPTQVTNDEFKRTSDPFLNYGQTTGAKFRTLEMRYKSIANKSAGLSKFSSEGMNQFNYKEKMKIDYRTQAQRGNIKYGKDINRQDKAAGEEDTGVQPFGQRPPGWSRLR